MNQVPQGLILGSELFNMVIDDVDDKVEHTLSKFAGNTKVGGTVSMLEDRVVFQRDIDRLEKSSWRETSWSSPTANAKSCTWDGKISCNHAAQALTGWKADLQKRTSQPRSWMGVRISPMWWRPNTHSAALAGADSRLWEGILPLNASEAASGVPAIVVFYSFHLLQLPI